MNYKTKGVCSREITFDVQDHKVVNVHFNGGCSGNTQGLSRLVEGMDIDEAIHRLEGIKCGFKPTSCPDQLAQAPGLRQKRGDFLCSKFCLGGYWIKMPSVTGAKPSITPSFTAA